MTRIDTPVENYEWVPQPEAAALIDELLQGMLKGCAPAVALADRMRRETGTRLLDWVDHIAVHAKPGIERRFEVLGFVRSTDNDQVIWNHPRGLFPTVLMLPKSARPGLAIKTEWVADFLISQQLENIEIIGEPLSMMRKARAWSGDTADAWIIERHGVSGFDAPHTRAALTAQILKHHEAFRRRARHLPTSESGFDHAMKLIRAAKSDLGTDLAADRFFAAEREYWMSRNAAARCQYARQQRLGLGWANHDHHTYRSSRSCFHLLIAALEELGMVCRERFYAGRDAGWGAQVLEQRGAGVVVFADVDLNADEVAGDFAHEPLPPLGRAGTVGLWCRLHGEAFLEAGMHHLECQFDFDAAREQLKAAGFPSMKPFTFFPHLKQAFTEPEVWAVDPKRIEAAKAEGLITAEQAAKFAAAGVIGSHLEILQRDDGYKGFNQTGISEIIHRTDPRHAASSSAGA